MLKVLVVCDDLWHPAEVIELGLKELEGDEFSFTIVKAAKDILTPERIAKYPVIMVCKGNSINASNPNPWFEDTVTEVGPVEFEKYVKNGGGFLSIHAGNTSKLGNPYTNFVGNYFLGHPLRNEVSINVTNDHPITKGVNDFEIRDEHYQMVVTAKDAVELIRSTSDTGGNHPAGYAREIEKGRLCALTPGHCVDVWHHEEFKKLLSNAIYWVAGKK